MRAVPFVLVCALAASIGCAREGARPAEPTAAFAQDDDEAMKEAFVDGANAACQEYDEADEQVPYPGELDAFVPFMRDFLAIGDVLQAKLEALDPPPTDAAEIRDWLEGGARMTRVVRAARPEIEAAVRANDQAEAERVLDDAIDEFNRISESLDPFARSYGMLDCANPSEP